MSRPSTPLTLDEHGGSRFADLPTAQTAARAGFVFDLKSALRALLETGELTIRDGQLVPTAPLELPPHDPRLLPPAA